MKQLFLSVAILSIMASCSQNEITEGVTTNQNPIGFSTLNSSVTRAANENNSDYTVYAQYTDKTLNPYTAAWFIDALQIKTTNGTDEMQGDQEYYWPSKELEFYAFSPSPVMSTDEPLVVTNGVNVVGTAPGMGTSGTLSINYTVPSDAGTDFTVAKPVKRTAKPYGETTDPVAFKFAHMLSKVSVSAQVSSNISKDYKFVLTDPMKNAEVIFTVLSNKGTVDLTADTPALTPLPLENESKVLYKTTTVIITTSEEPDHTKKIYHYIIPHTKNKDCKVEIIGLSLIKFTDTNPIPQPYKLEHTFTGAEVEGSTTNHFKANTQYDIVFKAHLDKITFGSEIVNWWGTNNTITVPL